MLLQAISWNVDGLRAPGRKEVLAKLVADEAPDIICLQETKLQEMHVKDWEGALEGYASHWSCSTTKKGYAGTAVFLKEPATPTKVTFGIDDKAHDGEGRSITVEYGRASCAAPPPPPPPPPPGAASSAAPAVASCLATSMLVSFSWPCD